VLLPASLAGLYSNCGKTTPHCTCHQEAYRHALTHHTAAHTMHVLVASTGTIAVAVTALTPPPPEVYLCECCISVDVVTHIQDVIPLNTQRCFNLSVFVAADVRALRQIRRQVCERVVGEPAGDSMYADTVERSQHDRPMWPILCIWDG
jgi:hypothetical protein